MYMKITTSFTDAAFGVMHAVAADGIFVLADDGSRGMAWKQYYDTLIEEAWNRHGDQARTAARRKLAAACHVNFGVIIDARRYCFYVL